MNKRSLSRNRIVYLALLGTLVTTSCDVARDESQARSTTQPIPPTTSSKLLASSSPAATAGTDWVTYDVAVSSQNGYHITGAVSLGKSTPLSNLAIDFSGCAVGAPLEPDQSSLIFPVRFQLQNASPGGFEADVYLAVTPKSKKMLAAAFAEGTPAEGFECHEAVGEGMGGHFVLDSMDYASREGYVYFQDYFSPSKPSGSPDTEPSVSVGVNFYNDEVAAAELSGPGVRANGMEVFLLDAGLAE